MGVLDLPPAMCHKTFPTLSTTGTGTIHAIQRCCKQVELPHVAAWAHLARILVKDEPRLLEPQLGRHAGVDAPHLKGGPQGRGGECVSGLCGCVWGKGGGGVGRQVGGWMGAGGAMRAGSGSGAARVRAGHGWGCSCRGDTGGALPARAFMMPPWSM